MKEANSSARDRRASQIFGSPALIFPWTIHCKANSEFLNGSHFQPEQQDSWSSLIRTMSLVSLWNHQNSWISYPVSFQNTPLNPHPVNLLTLEILYYYLKFYSIYLNWKKIAPIYLTYHPPLLATTNLGFPGGSSGKEPACQFRRHKRSGFDPWVRKIPWRGKWQPTPVFLPGESPWTEEAGAVHGITKSWTRLQQPSTQYTICSLYLWSSAFFLVYSFKFYI